MREQLSNWTPTKQVPLEIVAQARALLAAMNASEPPEGWDNYEGEPDDGSTATSSKD